MIHDFISNGFFVVGVGRENSAEVVSVENFCAAASSFPTSSPSLPISLIIKKPKDFFLSHRGRELMGRIHAVAKSNEPLSFAVVSKSLVLAGQLLLVVENSLGLDSKRATSESHPDPKRLPFCPAQLSNSYAVIFP